MIVGISNTISGEKISLVYDEVKEYLLANKEAFVTDYLPKEKLRFEKGKPVVFFYKTVTEQRVERIKIEFSFDSSFSIIEREESFFSGNDLVIYNLKTNCHYYFRITLILKDGNKIMEKGEFETVNSPRMINLDGACNVRDIGAWKTESGKIIKQGLLYRGSEIDGVTNKGHPDFCLTSLGIKQSRQLGIKTDFDLRSSNVKSSEYSILGSDVIHSFYNAVQYQAVTDSNNVKKVKEIFSALANPSIYPVYLHCTHGVDRAGTIVLLLEGLLGVSKADIIRDYELSAYYYNFSHVNRNFQNSGNILSLIKKLEQYSGETFADNVASFLLSTGVTQTEINNIRTFFLD